MRFTVSALLPVLFLTKRCIATLYQSIDDLPATNYDFIVVGGGTAGNVVANRLTENPEVAVLVIEAGPTNADVLLSEVPFLCSRLVGSAWDYNFTTTPQTGLNRRTIPEPRGFMFGGSSSINFLIWTRGSKDDFDRFATVSGDDGWAWDNMQKYIHKAENWTLPVDNHNITGQFDPSVHQSVGINSVSLSGFSTGIDDLVIDTTESNLKDDFPFLLDVNAGRPLGVGWVQSSIKGGQRSSSATSYMGEQFISRANLHVVLNTRVKRLLTTPSNSTQPTFTTVEILHANGSTRNLLADKEVIMSAGSISSPHILLLSGIGNVTELSALGIEPIVESPNVGHNLYEHPIVTASWSVASNDTFDDINRNQTIFDETLDLWNSTPRTGRFVNVRTNQIAWLRLNESDIDRLGDPAAGVNTPHIELGIANGFTSGPSTPAQGNFISIFSAVVSPTSKGSLKLNTTNILDQPLIDPQILTSEFDIYTIREGLKRASKFLTAKPWEGYVLQPFGAFANATTDDLLDEFIRANTITVKHPVGTLAMSSDESSTGVVGPHLNVKGVNGLRVVDASVFPFIPSGHTQAPTYFFAERAADLIKSAWDIQQ